MAGSATDYLENKIIDHALTGKTAFTKPTVYVGLFTVAPTDSTAGTEVTGNAYARVATAGADWNAASGGSATNATTLTFPTPTPSGWGTVVAFGGFDASTSGNLLWYSDQTPNKTVNAGDPPTFPAGAITVTQT
jgi:hypothetical protein